MSFSEKTPIIACSTPMGQKSALAIVRLSGFSDILDFRDSFSISLRNLTPRKTFLTRIKSDSDELIDESVITFFSAPHSFTGENVLEISCHGNPLIVDRIIQLFIEKYQFRLARPGEFSLRALENKKLSLAQVEGLDLVLNATNSLMQTQGLDLLHGKLFKQYQKIKDLFILFKSSLELNIDFSDDIGEEEGNNLLHNNFSIFFSEVEQLFSRVKIGASSLFSMSVVIFGKSNAGKSSLFNELLFEKRSIVSSMAGTTRDFVSENIVINGSNFKIIDTAGVRDSKDFAEIEGIERSRSLLQDAFFKILVINPFDGELEAETLSQSFDLIVFTHADCPDFNKAISSFKVPEVELILGVSIRNKELNFVNFSESFEKVKRPNSNVDGDFVGSGSIGPDNIAPIGPERIGPIEPDNIAPIGPKSTGPIEPGKLAPIGPKINNPTGSDNLIRIESKYVGPIEPARTAFENRTSLSSHLDAFLGSGEDGPSFKSRHYLNMIFQAISKKYSGISQNSPILVPRHRESINKIYLTSKEIQSLLKSSGDVGVISSEVSILSSFLEELIGIVSPDDILDDIFSNFCIGK